MAEWQPIATAPKDSDRILITDGEAIEFGRWGYDLIRTRGGTYQRKYCWLAENYGYDGDSGEFMNPSHWMPPPEPPKEQK